MWGVYLYILMFCQTSFFLNEYMNIHQQINVVLTALPAVDTVDRQQLPIGRGRLHSFAFDSFRNYQRQNSVDKHSLTQTATHFCLSLMKRFVFASCKHIWRCFKPTKYLYRVAPNPCHKRIILLYYLLLFAVQQDLCYVSQRENLGLEVFADQSC